MKKITYSIEKNDKYTNTKNYTDNKHAKIMSYIQKKYDEICPFIVLIAGQK